MVDLACFSEGVKFVDFCRAGVVDVACFLWGVEFVDFCQLGVVGGVKDLFLGEVGSVDFRQARGVVDEA